MALQPNIILSGQGINAVGALSQGAQAGQQINDFRQTNALRDLYKQRGGEILAGDQGALNALAQFSPEAALGVQDARLGQESTRLGMQATQQRMAMLSREEQRQVAAAAAQMSAAERAQEAARIEQGVASALQAQTPEQWDAIVGQYDESLVGQFDNREAIAGRYMSIADSLKRMDERNDPNGGRDVRVGAQEILEDGTIIQSTSEGPRVYSPTGEVVTGQAAADAIAAANAARVQNETAVYQGRREGTLTGDINLGGVAAAVEDVAEATVDAGVAAWEGYGRIQTNLSNIDEAISAIDGGAKSGIIYNMLPSVTEASASLENSMNRMGLDIVGAVTFGALSEGELRLAMETAVPRNLGPEELRSWLVRKRDAQQKAAAMLADAAQFLTTPGNTLNDWIAKNTEGRGGGQARDGAASVDFSDMGRTDLLNFDMSNATLDDLNAWNARMDELEAQ